MSSNTRYADYLSLAKPRLCFRVSALMNEQTPINGTCPIKQSKVIKQIVGVCHSRVLRIGAIKENGRELTHLMKDYGEDMKSFCYLKCAASNNYNKNTQAIL